MDKNLNIKTGKKSEEPIDQENQNTNMIPPENVKAQRKEIQFSLNRDPLRENETAGSLRELDDKRVFLVLRTLGVNATPVLLHYLKDSDPTTKKTALEILSNTGNPHLLQIIKEYCTDEDQDVRKTAIAIMAKNATTTEYLPDLITILEEMVKNNDLYAFDTYEYVLDILINNINYLDSSEKEVEKLIKTLSIITECPTEKKARKILYKLAAKGFEKAHNVLLEALKKDMTRPNGTGMPQYYPELIALLGNERVEKIIFDSWEKKDSRQDIIIDILGEINPPKQKYFDFIYDLAERVPETTMIHNIIYTLGKIGAIVDPEKTLDLFLKIAKSNPYYLQLVISTIKATTQLYTNNNEIYLIDFLLKLFPHIRINFGPGYESEDIQDLNRRDEFLSILENLDEETKKIMVQQFSNLIT